MKGRVDDGARALLPIRLGGPNQRATIEAWIDTAFTGDLVVPRQVIVDLELAQTGAVPALLADGVRTEVATYEVNLEWFGQSINAEVIASDAARPLLGLHLLIGHRLTIDYAAMTVELLKSPASAEGV